MSEFLFGFGIGFAVWFFGLGWVVLTSNPVQYEYRCDKCGYVDYQYM